MKRLSDDDSKSALFRKLFVVWILFVTAVLRAHPAAAEDVALVASSASASQSLADRIVAAGYTAAQLTPDDAMRMTATDWSAFRVVWFVSPTTTGISLGGSSADGTTLMAPSGVLGDFVRAGGVLVIELPRLSAPTLADPLGAYFSPSSSAPSAARPVAATHPLLTGLLADGTSYGGVALADGDLNLPLPAGAVPGHWVGTSNATVIAADDDGARLVEQQSGSGRVLLVGLYAGPHSNLTHNLIRYTTLQR